MVVVEDRRGSFSRFRTVDNVLSPSGRRFSRVAAFIVLPVTLKQLSWSTDKNAVLSGHVVGENLTG